MGCLMMGGYLVLGSVPGPGGMYTARLCTVQYIASVHTHVPTSEFSLELELQYCM